MHRRITFLFPLLSFILLLFISVFMSGCGSSNKSQPAGSGTISGNWQMELQSSNSNVKPFPQSGFLLEEGDAVSGSVVLIDDPCSGVGSVNGTVSGSSISLSVSPIGLEVNLTGTLGSDQASMSGTYAILPAGCSGRQTAPQTGTWTANLVQPLNGTIQGTLTSNYLGTSFPITGQVSQGANGGLSNSPLSGSLSATGYCFTTANVVGVISGTSVVMNLVNSDGTQVGQVVGTITLDGTSLTGTYALVPQPGSSQSSCRGGESGTATLTL